MFISTTNFWLKGDAIFLTASSYLQPKNILELIYRDNQQHKKIIHQLHATNLPKINF